LSYAPLSFCGTPHLRKLRLVIAAGRGPHITRAPPERSIGTGRTARLFWENPEVRVYIGESANY